MDAELLFQLAFPLAAPFWLLMIVAPNWSITRRVIGSPLIAVPALLIYPLAVLPEFGAFASALVSPTFDGVAALIVTPAGTAAVWAHLIGFDLLVGRWMYLDARERGVSALLMAPVLVATILLAPLGFLAYLGLRAVSGSPGSGQAERS